MFVWLMVGILGLSVAGAFVNLYEIAWVLWYMRRWPLDILGVLVAGALGIYLGLRYLG